MSVIQNGTSIPWRITVSIQSLPNLVEWYTSMLQAIQFLSNTDVHSKLKNCLETGKLHAEALSNNPNELRREIEQYLQENRPFEWNRNRSARLAEDRAEKDCKQHDNLTIFAMLVGNKELLKKWGVDYPLSPTGPDLADASRAYIEALEKARDLCNTASQREYYNYLIEQLNSHA